MLFFLLTALCNIKIDLKIITAARTYHRKLNQDLIQNPPNKQVNWWMISSVKRNKPNHPQSFSILFASWYRESLLNIWYAVKFWVQILNFGGSYRPTRTGELLRNKEFHNYIWNISSLSDLDWLISLCPLTQENFYPASLLDWTLRKRIPYYTCIVLGFRNPYR